MKKVQIIEANPEKTSRDSSRNIDKIRVGVYVRVSTDSEEQLLSYHSQVDHYKMLVESNPEWQLVDIYADEGISGTQIKNRLQFQRMIADALDDKIDLIITKSISRFTRNVLDSLKYVRLLKENNVAIFFEKENINTMTMNGEMLLVILSSLAQQESESISANVKMGLKMKMKRGELVGFHGCLGYDYDKVDKTISINEKEAETVRYIFKRYVEGAGCRLIARELSEKGCMTKRGSKKWGESGITRIVKNEKYKGDILLGKTFTVDPLTHRRLENFGEEAKYYIEENHDPIISVELFEKAQEILARRSTRKAAENGMKREKYSRQYAFSSKMKCGFCGGTIGRRSIHGNSKYKKVIWSCLTGSKKGKGNCPHCKGIQESIIEESFVSVFNQFGAKYNEVVDEFVSIINESVGLTQVKKEMNRLNDEQAIIQEKLSRLVEMNLEGVIDSEIYKEKLFELNQQKDELKTEISKMDQLAEEEREIEEKVIKMKKRVSTRPSLGAFDREVFESAVEEVVIGNTENGAVNPYMISFVMKSGLVLEDDCMER